MAKDDYDVGYRKPPVGSRFKKGVSGNPSGRPKRSWSLQKNVIKALEEKVIVTKNGKEQRIPRHQLLADQLAVGAIKLDPQCLKLVLQFEQSYASDNPSETVVVWERVPITLQLEEDDERAKEIAARGTKIWNENIAKFPVRQGITGKKKG